MLEQIIRYLRGAAVPFRLTSYSSAEEKPDVAHPSPPGGVIVDVRAIVVDGRPAIACMPRGEMPDLGRLASAIGAAAVTNGDPTALGADGEPTLAPLGGMLGVPLFLDEALRDAAWIVFRASAPAAFVEIAYEDFARLERPRIAAFAGGGALPPHDGSEDAKGRGNHVFRISASLGAWEVFDEHGHRVSARMPTQADAVGRAKELAKRDGGAQIVVTDERGFVVSEFHYLEHERPALEDVDDRSRSIAATRPAHAHRHH
jgi:prolyl-tRNA editing enzyme YbaK/EbsC (Cys-tRNA(Pro) deacylase)